MKKAATDATSELRLPAKVRCPKCNAKIGQPCFTFNGFGSAAKKFHRARIAAAKRHDGDERDA